MVFADVLCEVFVFLSFLFFFLFREATVPAEVRPAIRVLGLEGRDLLLGTVLELALGGASGLESTCRSYGAMCWTSAAAVDIPVALPCKFLPLSPPKFRSRTYAGASTYQRPCFRLPSISYTLTEHRSTTHFPYPTPSSSTVSKHVPRRLYRAYHPGCESLRASAARRQRAHHPLPVRRLRLSQPAEEIAAGHLPRLWMPCAVQGTHKEVNCRTRKGRWRWRWLVADRLYVQNDPIRGPMIASWFDVAMGDET